MFRPHLTFGWFSFTHRCCYTCWKIKLISTRSCWQNKLNLKTDSQFSLRKVCQNVRKSVFAIISILHSFQECERSEHRCGNKDPSLAKRISPNQKWSLCDKVIYWKKYLNLKYCWPLQYFKKYCFVNFFCKFVFKTKSRWFVDIRC